MDRIAGAGFSILIILHYIGLWRLTRRHAMDSEQVKTYRADTGRLILWVLALPFILGIAYAIIHATVIHPRQISQARKDAGVIVLAIEQFHTHTGKYPSRLDELVPEYLERVPQLPGDVPFGYQSKNDGYTLAYVYTDIAPVFCHHSTNSIGWYCD